MKVFGMFILMLACEKKENYSDIVLKNYLQYEINRAATFLLTTSEGEEAGMYRAGSKQTYQQAIDKASLVAGNNASSQAIVDRAYKELLQAGEDFFDQMVPFRAVFQELIDYAGITLNSAQEGDQEGNAIPGSKQVLQAAIDGANQTLSQVGLTQRMLDKATTDLTDAIYSFDRNINGRGLAVIPNSGFELPGYATTDFGLVEGWKVFGVHESWAPLASVSEEVSAPEGQFVARIGSYTQGIYQQLFERIHPNSEYELIFKVAILSNKPDWQGKFHKVIVLSRIISFSQEPGNYDYLNIISESYDTLGLNPAGYVELKHTFTVGAASSLEGERIAVDFLQRHTWNKDEPIYAESFVGIDQVKLFRKMN